MTYYSTTLLIYIYIHDHVCIYAQYIYPSFKAVTSPTDLPLSISTRRSGPPFVTLS